MTPRRRLLLLALLVGASFALAAAFLPHTPAGLRDLAAATGPIAPIAALAAFVVLTCALFPGHVMALACGLAFGAGVGTAVAWVGATLGAVAAFAIARGAGRGAAEQIVRERFASWRERLERRGFVTVLIARLAPGTPIAAFNYGAGLSRMRARHFALGTALGALPRAVAYAVLGAGLASGIGFSPALIAGAALIAVLTVAGALVALRRRRRTAATPA